MTPRSPRARGGLLLMVMSVLVVLGGASAAVAQATTVPVQRDADIIVATNPAGVVTSIQIRYSVPADPTTRPAAETAAADPQDVTCQTIPAASPPPGAPPAAPDTTYAYLACRWVVDLYGLALIQVEVDAGGAPVPATVVIDPEQLARTVSNYLPAPAVTIAASPTVGLVGEPTWFWLATPSGTIYDGEPLVQTTTLGAVTVEVEATPTRYTWRFGEPASQVTTSITGRPGRGDIQHVYQRAASAAQVSVTFNYTVRWRQPGLTGWADLDPITREVTTTVPVAQSQGVLTR